VHRHNMPRPLWVVPRTATHSFQLGGHCTCQWCRLPYSICIPSLKCVGFPIPKMWLIIGHTVKQPVDFDLWSHWPRPLNAVTGYPCYGLPSCQFSACYALLFLTYGEARDKWTDRQTMAINAYAPALCGWGITAVCM